MLGDRFAQRQDAERVSVPGPAVLERLLGGLADDGRRLEVGLAELEVDDVDPLALHGLGALEHLHREERLDLLGAPRGLSRQRAARISRSIRGPSLSTPTLEPG